MRPPMCNLIGTGYIIFVLYKSTDSARQSLVPSVHIMSLLSGMECLGARAHKPTAALLFLHGLGETGRDPRNLFAKKVGERGHPYIKMYFPTAEKRYMKVRDKVTTYWFDAERLGPQNADVVGKIEDANKVVDLMEKWVEEIEATGIPRSRIAIGGTSQGGIVAIYAAYGRGLEVGAVVSAASTLLFLEQDVKYTSGRKRRVPLLSLYGKNDAFIEESNMGRNWKALRELKIDYTPRTLPNCGHTMDETYVQYMLEWLEMKIPVSDL